MATILNQGQTTIKNDLDALFEALQDERVNLLRAVRDVQQAERVTAAAEARRLAEKFGSSDPRIAALAARDATILERIGALDVEIQIAAIRTPPVTKTETIIQGRITDDKMTAAGQVKVKLVDENGRPLTGVAPVETDDSGYYAIILTPEQVKDIGANRTLSVMVAREEVSVVPSAAKPFVLAPGTIAVNEFNLTHGELDRLRLLPIAAAPEAGTGPGVPKGRRPAKTSPVVSPPTKTARSAIKRPAKKK